MEKKQILRVVSVLLLMAMTFAFSAASAVQFTPSHVTYDTTYEKILQMYLKVINGYGTADYGRHDLFNNAIYGNYDPMDGYKSIISRVKRDAGFMLFDCNQDGIDELMIGNGGGYLYEVFTMDEGRVRELIRAGGDGTASSEYSCALLVDGRFYRKGHGGALLDYYELWQMNGTGKVSFVEGYHTEGAWDSAAETENTVWYRSDAPMSRVTSSPSKRVSESVAKNWIRTQEWNIYTKKFVPFAVYEKFPDDPWNIAALSVKGKTSGTAKVKIRKEASAKAQVVATKNVGTYVRVLDKEGEYFLIAFDGKEGYVQQEYLKPVTYEITPDENITGAWADTSSDEESGGTDENQGNQDPSDDAGEPARRKGVTRSANVKMREKADKKSRLATTVKKKGSVLIVTDETVGEDGQVWYQVEFDGHEGYIRGDFLEVSEIEKAGEGGELYGLVIKKLATRSGPSPRAEDTGTYSVVGQKLRIYSRAYDPIENAWWVKCDVPYHGKIRTLWAWYTRFDSKTLPLEVIPVEPEE